MASKFASVLAGLLGALFLGMAAPVAAESRFFLSSVAETSFDDAPALAARFTEAIDPGTDLGLYLGITPAPAAGVRWVAQDGGRQWILPFVEPSTEYRVRVRRPPIAESGRQLQDVPVARNGKTLSSFDWRLTTRKLQAGAAFASDGHYLVGPIQNGLPVSVVNLAEIDLDVFRVRDAELERFLAAGYFQGQVYNNRLDRIAEYADLVHSARYPTAGRENQRHTLNLNLDPVLEPGRPGVYLAVLRQPGEYAYSHDTRFFTLSDLGLHLRRYRQGLVVYANSIADGAPLADLRLQFWWPGNQRRAERRLDGRTGLDGSYHLATNDPPRVVLARRGENISFLRLDRAALDLSAFANVTERHRELRGFLYGPRDLYRPGETVAINLLLRDHDGRALPSMPVQATVFDARGRRHSRFTWNPQSDGSYRHRFDLGRAAPTGRWRMQVGIDGTDLNASYSFQVEEFLPENLSLSFYDGDLAKPRRAGPGEIRIPVRADYLYGAPAAGNRVDALVTVRPVTEVFERHPGYQFGNAGEPVRPRSLSLPPVNLDAAGAGELVVPDNWADYRVPLRFRIAASVYESGGRPVTRNQSVIRLPPTDGLLGVRPEFDGRPPADSTVGFSLISVDRNGDPRMESVNWRLVRDHRELFWEYDDNRGWHWERQSNRYTVRAGTLDLAGAAKQLELPLAWGDYELVVESESGGAVTRYAFRTQYGRYGLDRGAALKPDQVLLGFDRDAYRPGDTAVLNIEAPVAGAAVLNIESADGVLFSQRLVLARGAGHWSFEIPAHWDRHDLYATAMLLTPADQVTELAPKRAIGIAHLPLLREDAVLEVVLEAPEKVEPNRPVTASLRLLDPTRARDQALYASFALVDKGVLNITDYQRPRPEQFFFAPRRFEADYFDVYGSIINNLGYDMARQRFGGGAGGDEDLARGGDRPKSEVQILSFFSEPVALVDGRAQVSFDLPSFNGRLKWMAVVYGERSYASAELETTVADRLVTQMALPRFLAPGDQSRLALDLHNLSGVQQVLELQIEFDGRIDGLGARHSLRLADGEKTSLPIPVRAGESEGQGQVRIRVGNGGDLLVERQWTLGVRSAWPAPTRRLRASIEPQGVWRPGFEVAGLRPETLRARLTLSDRPAVDFAGHLDGLLDYPYGCLEQVTSTTWPWLLVDADLVERLDLGSALRTRFSEPFSARLRFDQIESGIRRILDKQLASGGFGFWTAGGAETQWGSAYASEALVEARELGVAVDQAGIRKALERLQAYLRDAATEAAWSQSRDYQEFAYRAYAGYVLARAGLVELSQLRRLYEQSRERRLDQSGLAWMHLAAALQLAGDTSRAAGAAGRALAKQRAADAYYRDYGSPLRDTASMLALALRHGLDPGELPQRLEDQVYRKRWYSTQERVALLRLARWYSEAGEGWQARLVSRDGMRRLDRTGVFSTVLDGAAMAALQSVQAVERRLHVGIVYQGASIEPPQPYARELWIERTYYDVQGREIAPEQVPAGSLLVVRLQVGSEQLRVPEALVVDLLPAGLELENQNLAGAAVSLDEVTIDGTGLAGYFRDQRPTFEEYRDDRYVAAVALEPDRPANLYYLARAVSPGSYAVPNPYVEDMYRPELQALGPSPARLRVLDR